MIAKTRTRTDIIHTIQQILAGETNIKTVLPRVIINFSTHRSTWLYQYRLCTLQTFSYPLSSPFYSTLSSNTLCIHFHIIIWLVAPSAYPTTPLNTQTPSDILLPIPIPCAEESEETLRARLVHQSRKCGTLESDLLLSTFGSRIIYADSPPTQSLS
ncbi:hypothetical protein C8R48DRAFT_300636 [Suillus tomentosus]|nr:hypothetical protein C8R48DRAFT_300636 [Suillus tomentosus]